MARWPVRAGSEAQCRESQLDERRANASPDPTEPHWRGPAPTGNWLRIEDGRIARIRLTFDPREIVAS
jgi:hypothetical protein